MRKNDPFSLYSSTKQTLAFVNCKELVNLCSVICIGEAIGANPKKTPSISKEEENLMWETGVLGCKTPETLQRSVFFYVGKCF